MTNRSTSSPSNQNYCFVSNITIYLPGHLASDILEQHFVLLFPQQSSADTVFNINVIGEHENSRLSPSTTLVCSFSVTYVHTFLLLLKSCSTAILGIRYNYMCSCINIMAHLGFSGFKNYYVDYRLVIKSYLPV